VYYSQKPRGKGTTRKNSWWEVTILRTPAWLQGRVARRGIPCPASEVVRGAPESLPGFVNYLIKEKPNLHRVDRKHQTNI
jgi:hypothetical protein